MPETRPGTLNDEQHLLLCLMEECHEVSSEFAELSRRCSALGIRISKALRFGTGEIQPGQELTNADRLVAELGDLMATAVKLRERGFIGPNAVQAKSLKLDKFMEYARKCGTLEAPDA